VTQDVPLPRRFRPDTPPPLERIVMQCLEKRAEHRYPSAADLAQDLERFLGGASVLARRYSTWTRALRWSRVKWKSLVVAALLAAAIGVAGWAPTRERSFDPGRWVLAYDWDGTTTSAADAGVTLVHGNGEAEVTAWPRGDYGLRPQRAAWCWLDPIQVTGDVRLELVVRTRDHLDGIELALSSQRQDPSFWSEVPRGYSCQFSGYVGSLSFISRNERRAVASYAYGRASTLRQEQEYRLAFCRVGERLWMEVDGEEILHADYPLPMVGENMEQLGFRTYSHDLELLGVRVYRLAGAAVADPLAVPDAALQLGRFDQAIDGYEAIAAAYEGDVAARSLGRAYLAALQLDAVDAPRRAALRERLFADHGDSPNALTALEVEAAIAWQHNDFEQAFALIGRCFDRDPETQVMYRILELRKTPPAELVRPYLAYLGRTRKLRSLYLAHLQIADLSPLRDLDLEWLEVKNNQLTDLSPLQGMPLVWLRLGSNRISDLAPLQGMPLRWLSLDHNPVRDLRPLSRAPLKNLDLSGTSVRDLSPLTGMPLEEINLDGIEPLPDLAPLAQAPLRQFTGGQADRPLDLSRFRLGELRLARFQSLDLRGVDQLATAPLRELSLVELGLQRVPTLPPVLERLDCSRNAISDLAALSSTGLKRLDAADNRIADLSPLADLPLQHLDLSNNLVADLGPVIDGPLRHLSVVGNPLSRASLDAAVSAVPGLLWGDLHPGLAAAGSRFDPVVLADLVTAWNARPELESSAAALSALQAWRRDDAGLTLRSLAQRSTGPAWCLLPVWSQWQQARELAAAVGGRVMTADEALALDAGSSLPTGWAAWLERDLDVAVDDEEIAPRLQGGEIGSDRIKRRLPLLLVWDD
jgi:Leucine-rich repeat (LRR) protein